MMRRSRKDVARSSARAEVWGQDRGAKVATCNGACREDRVHHDPLLFRSYVNGDETSNESFLAAGGAALIRLVV